MRDLGGLIFVTLLVLDALPAIESEVQGERYPVFDSKRLATR